MRTSAVGAMREVSGLRIRVDKQERRARGARTNKGQLVLQAVEKLPRRQGDGTSLEEDPKSPRAITRGVPAARGKEVSKPPICSATTVWPKATSVQIVASTNGTCSRRPSSLP